MTEWDERAVQEGVQVYMYLPIYSIAHSDGGG